jgi:hypothetical protein
MLQPKHSLFHLTMFENYPPLEFCKVPNYHATSPPSPAEFPPNFGTFGFHSRKPLVYEAKQFTWENHSTFPANRKIQAESKPIHPKGKQKRSLT